MDFDIKKLIIDSDSSIYSAMEIINNHRAQLAIVVDKNFVILGTITDGDIRRGIIKDHSLDIKTRHVMNTNFHFIKKGEKSELAFEIMKKENINQVPVIDENGKLHDLFLKDVKKFEKRRNNFVVIMAGGKGKRLRPYTENCPKPMIEVSGKPMLEIILEQCIKAGFVNFYFSVNYLKDKIINYFNDGSDWGVNIEYLLENKPLGTAGSLSLIPGKIIEPILVLNGDVLTQFNLDNLLSFHNQNKSQATIGGREFVVDIPFGVLEIDNSDLIRITEKPCYKYLVNAGIYVLEPSVLNLLCLEKYIDMPDYVKLIKDSGFNVGVCPIHEYWIDVGKPESLRKADKEWKKTI